MNKQDVINTAMKKPDGGYVNTDGEWCMYKDPKSFATYLKSLGFTVTKAYKTSYATAIAETKEGIKVAYNGNCQMIKP